MPAGSERGLFQEKGGASHNILDMMTSPHWRFYMGTLVLGQNSKMKLISNRRVLPQKQIVPNMMTLILFDWLASYNPGML